MRKVIFAVVAAAALPSVALAAPGGVPGAPADHQNNGRHVGPPENKPFGPGGRHVGPRVVQAPAPTAAPEAEAAAKKAKPATVRAKLRPVAFVIRGVLTADAASDSFTMTVRGGNRHARRALDGTETLTVKLGPASRIVKVGMGRVTFSELKSGDRVLVMLRAPRKTAPADLPAAKWVIDIGPKPAETPPAAPTTAPTAPAAPTTPAV
jgi:hypothetical protein